MSIAEFVVGLGMDSSDFNRGLQGAEAKLGAFKSTILQTGAALGTAFTFKGLTFDFAKQVNEARQLAQFLGISTNNLVSMQRVAESFGADIGEMNSLFAGIAQAKSGVAVGQIGVFQELAKAGINVTDLIGAKDANEAVLRLSAQLEKIGNFDARKNVAAAIGLTPATLDMMIAGRKRLEELQKEYKDIRPVTERAEKASREWIAGLAELKTRGGRYSDALATEVTSGINRVIASINSFLRTNQGLIDQITGPAFKAIGENVEAVALGLGVLGSASVLGGITKMTAAIGGLAGIMGGLAASATAVGGAFAALWLWDKNPEDLFGKDFGKFLNMTPGELTEYIFGDAERAYEERRKGTEVTSDGAAIAPSPTSASGDVMGAPFAPSVVSGTISGKAKLSATIPVQITTNTNLPEATISRTVTKIMNRELDAALVRGEYGN